MGGGDNVRCHFSLPFSYRLFSRHSFFLVIPAVLSNFEVQFSMPNVLTSLTVIPSPSL